MKKTSSKSYSKKISKYSATERQVGKKDLLDQLVKPPKGWGCDYYSEQIYRLPKQIR